MARTGWMHVLIVFIASACFAPSHAEIPLMISYQGKVTDGGGTPVPDGTYPMRFTLYDAETGGNDHWYSGVLSVEVTDGIFNVLLGESPQDPLDLSFDEDYWLSIWIDGDTQTPRQRLGSVGYAYMASGLVPGTEVNGTITTGHNSAVKGVNNGTAGAVYGLSGVALSPGGAGVYGYNIAVSGLAMGVLGESTSTDGIGVAGANASTTGIARGVVGISYSTMGFGVVGENYATSGSATGVYGNTLSTAGTGVFGVAWATSGTTYGVYGRCDSPSGYGVYYSGGINGSGAMRTVVLTSKGPTSLDAVSAAGSWVEDFGEGQLKDGRCHIELDPLFLETVTIDSDHQLKVFVQLHDEGSHGVAVKKGATGFDVIELENGKSNGTFDYRVVAKRKGFEEKRLDYCKAAETDSYLYPEVRKKELRESEEKRARMDAEYRARKAEWDQVQAEPREVAAIRPGSSSD